MKNNRGFTLAEIMLVIAILGILVSVVVPRLTGRTDEARKQTARIQIENLGMALESYEFDLGHYPMGSEGLECLRNSPSDSSRWKGPYLKKDIPKDPWQNEYIYSTPGRHKNDFDLYSRGPDGKEGSEDDIGNW